ncbi:16S rRNA (guanine(966)-N(2))-methyltransferase RsmD [Leekyejoonella antrihumi]|uniref:16S rRNA (Guanine(966)-N(2))-methyltransferase RsmD n=1 Tax=Leekyejoonella antrihumi TaxID=1660198 RepID=A0A563DZQ6_9MICO|nr:16S rRNA (guanine(966)-N(2))-methyltransferase RsmD [Leekyejoonella antrihumi]TWP35675.1 16S rRNA (guanine(966)-N(2))-methyltransferase RsmD [Leekyejoonella antrihumi]
MTRIIAGTAGGRRIGTPPGSGTRPTSDRVREALFGRLEHLDALHEAHVLDLYAGSGALGLEAASRGAASVLLVESDRLAGQVIRRNITDLDMPQAQVRAEPVERVLAGLAPQRMHLVVVDPPYAVGDEALAGVLAQLVDGDWLAHDAVLVVERSRRSPEPTWPVGCEPLGPRRYGETTCWFAEYVPEGEMA